MSVSKTKRIMLLSVATALSLGGVISFLTIKGNNLTHIHAVDCDHQGYHYQAKEATFDEAGHDEFYACCKCHEAFLERPAVGTFLDASDDTMTGGVGEGHVAYIAPVSSWEERVMQSGAVFSKYFNYSKNPVADRSSGSVRFRVGNDMTEEEIADPDFESGSYFSLSHDLLATAKSTGAYGIAFSITAEGIYEQKTPNRFAHISAGGTSTSWEVNYDEDNCDFTQDKSFFVDLTKYDFDSDPTVSWELYIRNSNTVARNSAPANITLKSLTFLNSIDKIYANKAAAHSAFGMTSVPADGHALNRNVEKDIAAVDPVNKTITLSDSNTFHVIKPFLSWASKLDGLQSLAFQVTPNNPDVPGMCSIGKTSDDNYAYPYGTAKSPDGSIFIELTKQNLEDYVNLQWLFRGYSDVGENNSQGAVISGLTVFDGNVTHENMLSSLVHLRNSISNAEGYTLDAKNGVASFTGVSARISNAVLTSARKAGYSKMRFRLQTVSAEEGKEFFRITCVSDGVSDEKAKEDGWPGGWGIGFTAEEKDDLVIEIDLTLLDKYPSLYYKLEPQLSDYNTFKALMTFSELSFE